MRRRLQDLRQAQDGTVALEFALVGATFIILTVFIIGAGLLFWSKGVLQMAAWRTARCTAIGASTCSNPQAYATALVSTWGVAPIVPSISVARQTSTTCGSTAGHFSKVTITATPVEIIAATVSTTVLTATACYPSST